jgi:proteasome lid subunit RPN8/RPN11
MRALHLSHQQIDQIVQHAVSAAPDEACGLIAGQSNHVRQIIAMHNVADHPETNFEMAPQDLLKTLKRIDAAGLDLIGIYHSHPQGSPRPSSSDIVQTRRHLPRTPQLIVGLGGHQPQLQAWLIHDAGVDKVQLQIDKKYSSAEPAPPLSQKSLSSAQALSIIIAVLVAMALLVSISLSLLPPAPAIPTPGP